jgi:hypothetical protein
MKRWLTATMCVALGIGAGVAQKQRYSESHRPDLLEYPLTVHVTHARVAGAGTAGVLHLDTVIDGTKVELEANAAALLHVGDYRGRVVAADEKKSGWFSKSYELLFSDGTHVVFAEVAESE